jgi:hypothetical protein
MDLFHTEIISFCLRKATIKLASERKITSGTITQNEAVLYTPFQNALPDIRQGRIPVIRVMFN